MMDMLKIILHVRSVVFLHIFNTEDLCIFTNNDDDDDIVENLTCEEYQIKLIIE